MRAAVTSAIREEERYSGVGYPAKESLRIGENDEVPLWDYDYRQA
jgi:hypothetical protein